MSGPTTATVKYIVNGYTITSFGPGSLPDLMYAATIPEVVFWLGEIFSPPPEPPAREAKTVTRRRTVPSTDPRSIEPSTDPLMNQTTQVRNVESGGFIVNFPTAADPEIPDVPPQMLEQYCVNMDAVADLLTQIYTAPVIP